MKSIRCFVFVWRIGQGTLSNRITQKQKEGKWEPEDDIFDEFFLFMSWPLFQRWSTMSRTFLFFTLSFSFLYPAMSMRFICRIAPEVPPAVAMSQFASRTCTPPCNDPRIRAVNCPGGNAGFFGRFFSHVPRGDGAQLRCVLAAVRVIVRACDPDTDQWNEVEVHEHLTR
jgi:hypothetical protein